MLFSKASLPSQRVSEILRLLGDEALQRSFFSKYLTYISSKIHGSVLIDSTGLPNDIRFPLSAINNHNGVISNESKLILAIEIESKLPIYFRYVAGNILDVTTLQTTIVDMKEFGISVNHAIVDAGYYSEKNLVQEPNKKMNDIAKVVGLVFPPSITLYCGGKNEWVDAIEGVNSG